MLQYLHFSPRFCKQLRALARSDKKGCLAAEQADLIIEAYKSCSVEPEEIKAKRTKHGESRLRNCLKYDLGGGYRLVTLREGVRLFFVCVGSHDDTDLWLEKNRGYGIGSEFHPEFFETIPLLKPEGEGGDKGEALPDGDHDDLYEDDLLSRVDEKTLRQLFASFYNL